jgi:hypothetical protein
MIHTNNIFYLFVVGAPRSGTSILSNCLTRYSNVSFCPRSLQYLNKYNITNATLIKLLALYSFYFKKQGLNLHLEGKSDILWNHFMKLDDPIKRKRLIDNISMFSSKNTNCVFVNKRIANVNMLEELSLAFPNSAIVHISRDPVDTIMSILNMRKKTFGTFDQRWGVFVKEMPKQNSDPIVDCAIQYMKIMEVIEQAKNLFNTFIDVSYRDFCHNPFEILTVIAKKTNHLGCLNSIPEVRFHRNPGDEKVKKVVQEVFSNSLSEQLRIYALNL